MNKQSDQPWGPDRVEPWFSVLVEALHEHRQVVDVLLFDYGRLRGLFRQHNSLHQEAASKAREWGLIETSRCEYRGKQILEWIKLTHKAEEFLAQHESPRRILAELKHELGEMRGGVPTWMHETRRDLKQIQSSFEEKMERLLQRLDEMSHRIDIALKGQHFTAEVEQSEGTTLSNFEASVRTTILEIMDAETPQKRWSLSELFRKVKKAKPDLPLSCFHQQIKHLQQLALLQLVQTQGDCLIEECVIEGNSIYDHVHRVQP